MVGGASVLPTPRRSAGPLAVGRDVRGAAAVAVGGLGPLDVQVEELHLQTSRDRTI